jgi:hypothetical protein
MTTFSQGEARILQKGSLKPREVSENYKFWVSRPLDDAMTEHAGAERL